tara:strand:+ start:3747 stop:5414 length:1668 start_codon:yes stop_codon:yes gene_type:complete
MSDLREVLKEEYEKSLREIMDPHVLMSLIEEAMGAVSPLLKEEAAAPPGVDFDPQQMLLRMIPDIAVSEIGWSDVRSIEDESGHSEIVSGPQRKLLEDYLANIAGGSFEERIASVSEFYTEGASLLNEGTADRVELITKAVSYLVFYKTLTKIVTNFNASSAGFSFESFLATLVSGEQVPANTGTIADYIDRSTGKEIPVSLKLYKEGQLEVGGSYTDLVNDLIDPNKWPGFPSKMRYVVCTKNLQGEGLQQEGQINIYQWDFTLDNIMDILAITKDSSSKNIMLPRQVVSALLAGQQSGTDVKLPERSPLPTDEELEQSFIANLKANLEQIEYIENAEEVGDQIADALKWAKNDDLFNKNKTRGAGGMNASYVKNWVTDNITNEKIIRDQVKTAIVAANQAVVASQKASARKDARNQEIQRMHAEGEFLNPEESAREYKKLGPRQKALALQNSLGVLQTGHFALNNRQSLMKEAPVNAIQLGSIKVGTKYVAEALNQVRDILNEEVYEIFQSLKILSDSLNSFFANGLKDDQLAKTSIDNAENIQSKEILQPDK